MSSEAERKLNDTYGWPVEEVDFGRTDEPDVDGCVLVKYEGDGVAARVAARPGLSDELRAGFATWALQVLEQFIEHGPEFDGWQKRSDGGWQKWGRRHMLPSMD
ncbi:hypothetical protein AB0D47_20610 [Streptomyces sp. NPDC048376]|uniref:hypothetical protein n=1 Tax=Streptomyces sp. NPDC048376 TaxID=3154926 RepID=UPI0034199129